MPRPPKADSSRALHAAARWATAVGAVLMGLAVLVLADLAIEWDRRRGNAGLVLVSMLAGAAVYFLVGVAFVLSAWHLRRKKFVPLIVAMVLSAVVLGFAGMSLLFNLLAMPQIESSWATVMHFLIVLATLAVFSTLLALLIRAYRALKNDPAVIHGFEPVLTPRQK